jgi:ABC-type spermidine/putrescine transport system permease subunit I
MTGTKARKGSRGRLEVLIAAAPIALVQTAFFLVPLCMTVVLSFQSSQYFVVVWSWDLSTWADVFSHWYYWSILLRTLAMAAATVALCLLIGFPVAYAMATRLGHLENHVKVLIIFAFLTDAVLKTYGWVIFLEGSGPLNYTLERLGLGPRPVDILYTPWAIVLGMVYNLLPFTIFTIYLSVFSLDRDLILAAYDAGASKVRAFWEITLPLCRPGIWAGSVLVFVLSLGEFLAPKVLGGGKSPMSAELIRQTFETRVNWPLGAALTIVLIAVGALAVLLFTQAYTLRRRGA